MSANISHTKSEQPATVGPVPAPALPPALFGAAPRTIVIHRPDQRHGFGFTLRHLVVYPPESLNELYDDGRHLAVGVLGAPMDTIFVRSVRAGGPAAAAGLRAGDRVVAVNDEPVLCGGGGRARAPYARVVQLAQREPRTLRLTVVPRDHDLLQRYFSEAAYNPETNQRPRLALEMPAPTITEHESRLFDAYRRPRVAPAPHAHHARPREADDAPEYASVTSLGSARFEPRRESDVSAAESKDSLGSFDSNSTLTGRELDDSIILSRIRKSLEQKEAFLRRPSQPTGWVTPENLPVIKQKEFYARPQKMQKTSWPPPSPPEDCSASVDSGTYSSYGEINGEQKAKQKQDKGLFVTTLAKIHETPSTGDSMGSISNGSSSMADDSSLNTSNQDNSKYPELHLVTTRAKQFLSGAEAEAEGRTALYRSELARLSTTRPEPSVALRRREYESRSAVRRDTRSLDAPPNNTQETDAELLSQSLSGNQLMITGSKHLHCPPPEGFEPEMEKVQMRARSNSAGSEGFPARRLHASDGSHNKRRFGLNMEQMEAINRSSLAEVQEHRYEELAQPKTNGHDTRLSNDCVRPQRPTQLSLAPPCSTATSAATTPASPSPSPSTPADSGFADETITRRQKKDPMGEEERAMRRVSYLKATWGDRLHGDSEAELSDNDHHLQTRSAEKKGCESSPAQQSESEQGIDIQGYVQVKMVVINGKRASDRSWKHVWAVLQGSKLHLYRHHPSQSPAAGGGGGGGGAAQGSKETLDLRYSMTVLADDYVKKKKVVRVTSAGGAEFLLHAGDREEDAEPWLRALGTKRPSEPSEPAQDARGLSPLPPQRSKKIGRNRSPTGPLTPTLPSSPKSKTWKGRMAKQLRRIQGGGGGGGPGAAVSPQATAGWLGAPLERCPSDPAHPGVPLPVTLCASAIEATGLKNKGLYRVPGNANGIKALAAALDRGEPPPPEDARWTDVHVATSLLKNYLRELPDCLLTVELYPAFIAADRAPHAERARELRRLVRALPDAHYETLKYLMKHLRRVVAHSESNMMEPHSLAIMFGPTLMRGADDDIRVMVYDTTSQCRIIESLINNYEWYFDEEESGSPVEPPGEEKLVSSTGTGNSDLLIHNVKKIEGKDAMARDIMSSIISAANRKMQRKPQSGKSPADKAKWSESRDKRPSSPPASPPHHLTTSLAHYDGLEGTEQASRPTYNTINQSTQERVKKFEQETMAMLQRGYARGCGAADASKAAAADLVSKELAALAGKRPRPHDIATFSIEGTGDLVSSLTNTFDQKLRNLNNSSPLLDNSIPYADHDDGKISESSRASRDSRASSVSEERVSPSVRTHELKTAWLSRDHRLSSSSSTDDTDHTSSDKLRKDSPRTPDKPADKKELDVASHNSSEPLTDDDKSVDLPSTPPDCATPAAHSPSPAHTPPPAPRPPLRLSNLECAKRNSVVLENDAEPDVSNKENGGVSEGVKLKRSESLNRSPERNSARVLRSESLNCRDSRLQRSDSLNKAERLSKVEKAEPGRRREAGACAWRSTKLKRKNGMPERGIKRRHTVGGTKDFDKDGWSSRHTRTSSPDLTHVYLLSPAPLVPPPRPPLESHV